MRAGTARSVLVTATLAALAFASNAVAASNPTPLATPSWVYDVAYDVTKAPYNASCGTDATVKIQAAIDGVQAQGGGGVLIPCTFTVSTLTLRPNVNLYGLGSSTSALVGNPSQNVLMIPDWTENVSIRNLTIQSGLNGIWSDTLSYHVIVDGVRFRNPVEAAIRASGSIERWTVANVQAEGGRWFYKHDFGQVRDENYLDKTLFRNVTATGQADYAWRIEVEYSHALTFLNVTVSQSGIGALLLAGGMRGTGVFNLVSQGGPRPGPDVVVAGSPGAPGASFQTVNIVGGALAGATAYDVEVRDPYGKLQLFGTPATWRVNAPAANVLVFAGIPTPSFPAIPAVPQTRYDVTKPPFNAPCNSGNATAALQSAINRASDVGAGLYIPCPLFVTTLTLRSNVHFYGRARRIDNGSVGSSLVGSSSADLLTFTPNAQNITFRNLNLYSGRNAVAVQKTASNVVFDQVSLSVPIEAAIRVSGTAASWFLNDVNGAGGQWFWRQDGGSVTGAVFSQVHTINQNDYAWALNVGAASTASFVNPIVHFAGRGAMSFAGTFPTLNVTGIYTERIGRLESGKDAVVLNATTGKNGGSPNQVHFAGGMIGGYTSFTRSDMNVASASAAHLYGPGYWSVMDPLRRAVFYGGFAARM